MEAITKDKFGPMIMAAGPSSVDFIRTRDRTTCVLTKYNDATTVRVTLSKIAEISAIY